MATILLVEDEAALADLIRLWLERAGYTCHIATTGREAIRRFYDVRPDLVLLDLGLPEMDGWKVCERIREVSQTSLIMLTAQEREESKVRGLQMGADDYVTKPFGFPELMARVQAVLRRASGGGQPQTVYHQGNLILDAAAHCATLDGIDLKLTPTEYRLLAFMMQHSGQLLTHRQILQDVWGPAYVDDLDSLRIYVRNLRRKIEGESALRYIVTEHGLGYRFLKTPLTKDERVSVDSL